MTCPPLHIPNKEWSGDRKELENYVAIERWALCKDEGCTCYVKHMETEDGGQFIECQDVGNTDGYRADLVQIVWDTVNECGTLPSDDAMAVLHLNWNWSTNPPPDGHGEPTIDCAPAYPRVPIALFVGVYAEGFPPPDLPIARDTRLALGGQWAYVNGDVYDGGSLSVPLNIFPAGADFTVWVAQNGDNKYVTMRADLYTVCACSCVL